MTPQRRRRRLAEEGDQIEKELRELEEELVTLAQRVSLMLRPQENARPTGQTTTPHPTATNPRPTTKPDETVKQAASKDLLSVGGESDGEMNIIYIALGGVFLLVVALITAYHFQQKREAEANNIYEFEIQGVEEPTHYE